MTSFSKIGPYIDGTGRIKYLQLYNTSLLNTSTYTAIGDSSNKYHPTYHYNNFRLTLISNASGHAPQARARAYADRDATAEIPLAGVQLICNNNSGYGRSVSWSGKYPYIVIEERSVTSGGRSTLRFDMWNGEVSPGNDNNTIELQWSGDAGAMAAKAPDEDVAVDVRGADSVTLQLRTPNVSGGTATFDLGVRASGDGTTFDDTDYVTPMLAQAESKEVTKTITPPAGWLKFRLDANSANPAVGEDTVLLVTVNRKGN